MSRVSIPPVTVVHYVDPLCPWSLGLEEPLRNLKNRYRDRLRVEYRTGVAVPEVKKWLMEYGFDFDSVKKFNAQVARRTGTNFDSDFLRKTGLRSSRPACLAFKAAQLQNEETAAKYLRLMMDRFIVQALPFNEEALVGLARDAGLDDRRLSKDMHSKKIEEAVEGDSKAMGKDNTSFLDLIVVAPDGRSERVAEAFDDGPLEKTIDRLVPGLPKYSPDGRAVG